MEEARLVTKNKLVSEKTIDHRPHTSHDIIDDFVRLPTSLDSVRSVISDRRITSSLRAAIRLRDAFKPFYDKKTTFNLLSGFLALGIDLIDSVRFDASTYFSTWTSLDSRYGYQLIDTAINFFNKLPCTVYKASNSAYDSTPEDVSIRICHCPNGADVGWVVRNDSQFVRVFTRASDEQKIDEFFRTSLWNSYGHKSIALSYIESDSTLSNHESIGFSEDTAFRALNSQKADELATEYALYKNSGVTRSVLFYGRPGAGKSTIIRTLIDKLKLRSLTISSDDINRLGFTDSLHKVIDILKPDAVVFDDIDRLEPDKAKLLLEFTERVYKQVKFIFTSVNVVDRLDEAMIRPERIDEIVELESLDREVIKTVLGDFAEYCDDVKTWPIAFVKEFATRCKVVGPQTAKKTMQELAQRVANISKKKRYTDLQLIAPDEHVPSKGHVVYSASDIAKGHVVLSAALGITRSNPKE